MAVLSNTTESITTLYRWYTKGNLIVNRRYQRKLVWTLEEKQKLIQSVIDNYPIPAIILSEREDGNYEIIDGLQRLHTIISFIEHKFKNQKGKRLNLGDSTTAKTRADKGIFKIYKDQYMDVEESAKFFDYHISVSVMKKSTNEEIDEVFRRINTYGHQLSNQERRQAGVQSELSNYVKDLADEIRSQEVISNTLELSQMPQISIDTPRGNFSYGIKASDVFWVSHGIISSNSLRDSLDEELIVGIVASIVLDNMIARDSNEFDKLYEDTPEAASCSKALSTYGPVNLKEEILFCIEEINNIVNSSSYQSLRDIILHSKNKDKKNTSAYPSIFTTFFVALHKSLISENKHIIDYKKFAEEIKGISTKITGAKSSENLRTSVGIAQAVFSSQLSHGLNKDKIYQQEDSKFIDEIILQHPVEDTLVDYKQGILPIYEESIPVKKYKYSVIEKVIKSICGIVNSAHRDSGYIIIGVADNKRDADAIEENYNIKSRKIIGKYVVGISRESNKLEIQDDDYVRIWKDGIENSGLSNPLKYSVLSSIRYYPYYGKGVIVIEVPPQDTPAILDGIIYTREGESTISNKFNMEDMELYNSIVTKMRNR